MKLTVQVPTTTISPFQIPDCTAIDLAIITFSSNVASLSNAVSYMYNVAGCDGGDLGNGYEIDGKHYIGPKLEELTEDFWKNFKELNDLDLNWVVTVARGQRKNVCDAKITELRSAYNELQNQCMEYKGKDGEAYESYAVYNSSQLELQNSRLRDIQIIENAKDGDYDG